MALIGPPTFMLRSTMRETKVLMTPDWRQGNPYLERLAESIAAAAQRSMTLDFDTADSRPLALNRLIGRNRKPAVLHLHWIKHLVDWISWSRSPVNRRLKLWMLELDLLLLQLRGVRLVWTLHNLVSHESPDPALELRIRAILARHANHVIAHSEQALELAQNRYGLRFEHKASVIPHGNYDNAYPAAGIEQIQALEQLPMPSPKAVRLLFFGAVRRYKGLEALLAAVQENAEAEISLLIAGKPFDPDLEASIRQMAAEDPRIQLRMGFVPESEVSGLFDWADLVALPFEQTLTSGSVILALTMGRPVLLPDSAKVLGVVNEDNTLFFSENRLGATIASLDRQKLMGMRAAARSSADRLDWKTIGKATLAVYTSTVSPAPETRHR